MEMEPYRLFLLGKEKLTDNAKLGDKKKSTKNGISWISQRDNWTYLSDD